MQQAHSGVLERGSATGYLTEKARLGDFLERGLARVEKPEWSLPSVTLCKSTMSQSGIISPQLGRLHIFTEIQELTITCLPRKIALSSGNEEACKNKPPGWRRRLSMSIGSWQEQLWKPAYLPKMTENHTNPTRPLYAGLDHIQQMVQPFSGCPPTTR